MWNKWNRLDARDYADRRWEEFSPMDFGNPEFRKFIIKSQTSARVLRSMGSYVGTSRSSVLKDYPLLDGFSYIKSDTHRQHIIDYINMIGEKNASN